MSLNGSISFSSSLDGLSPLNVSNIDGLREELDKYVLKTGSILTGDMISLAEFKTSVFPSSENSLTRRGYVDAGLASKADSIRFNAHGYVNIPGGQGIFIQWNRPNERNGNNFDGRNYYICQKGLGEGGHSFLVFDKDGNQVSRVDLEDLVKHSEMSNYLSPYLLVNTYNVEKQALLNNIALKLDASVISQYSTTQEMNTAISTALNSYYTKNQIDANGWQNQNEVNNLINSALVGYYTQSQINNFGFQNQNQVNSLITSALVNYVTNSGLSALGYQNANQVNQLISNALSSYSTVSGTSEQIISQLANYATLSFVNQELANYVSTSYLNSNFSTSASIANTYKTKASFDNDIQNFYTKAQSDSLFLPKTTSIIPYTDTGNPEYQFKVMNKSFLYGSQTYEIQITDANNITTSLIMGGGLIYTPNMFNGLTNQKFQFLENISSDVQTQLNSKANSADLNNFLSKSTFNNLILNYSTTNQLNSILTSYATVQMLNDFVPVNGYVSFNPDNYYTKVEVNNLIGSIELPDMSQYYTITNINAQLANFYTKGESDSRFASASSVGTLGTNLTNQINDLRTEAYATFLPTSFLESALSTYITDTALNSALSNYYSKSQSDARYLSIANFNNNLTNLMTLNTSQVVTAEKSFLNNVSVSGNLACDFSSIFSVDDQIFSSAANKWVRRTGGRLIMNSAGNLGIGNDNPVCKLDVNGNTNINGTVQINGVTTISNNLNCGAISSGVQTITSDGAWLSTLHRWTGGASGVGWGLGQNFKLDGVEYARIFGGIVTKEQALGGGFIDGDGYLNLSVRDTGLLNDSYTGGQMYIFKNQVTSNVPIVGGSTLSTSGSISTGNNLEINGIQGNGQLRFNGDNDVNARWQVLIPGNYRLAFYRNSSLQSFIEYNGAWVQISDERKKEAIEDLNPVTSLNKVLSLNAKHYRYKDQPYDEKTGIKSVGFIAQEVEQVVPWAISTNNDEDKTKAVAYNDIFVHNVHATKAVVSLIQQQKAEIDTLKNELSELKEVVRHQNQTLTQIVELLNSKQIIFFSK